MTCVRSVSVMRALKMRERPSVVPPGAAGVTKRIGRAGQSAAVAAAATKARQEARTEFGGSRFARMMGSPRRLIG